MVIVIVIEATLCFTLLLIENDFDVLALTIVFLVVFVRYVLYFFQFCVELMKRLLLLLLLLLY